MLVEDLVATASIVLAVAVVSSLLAYYRPETLGDGAPAGECDPGDVGAGSDARAIRAALWWAGAALAMGALATIAYLWLDGLWPKRSLQVFVTVGLGSSAALSVAAAVVRPRLRLAGVAECVTLILVWGVGYGLAIPLILQ
jgi:hypothetical protein